MRIIERTDEEYMSDLQKFYNHEMKPLLDKGMSLTLTFQKLGVSYRKRGRKYRELRKLALDDGYKLRK